jgi:hypothetical protein
MDSLAALNTRTTSVPFDDQRGAALQLLSGVGVNQSLIVDEADSFTHPVGNEILNIVNGEAVNALYQLDFTDMPRQGADVTVTWPSLPTGLTATNPSTGIWQVGRIDDTTEWDLIKAPTINLDSATSGVVTYTAAVLSNVGGTSWTVTLTITDAPMLSAATSNFTFSTGQITTITGAPELIDTAPDDNFNVIVYPSDTAIVNIMSSTGTGGTSVFNSSTKRLTLTGTQAQVNERLNNIAITFSSALSRDFVMTYDAQNFTSGEADTKTQLFITTTQTLLFNTRGFGYYVEDTLSEITQGPLVATAQSGNHTLVVSPNTGFTAAVTTMSSTGTGGTSTWNSSAKTLTIVGTTAQINSHIDNILLTPSSDYATDFILNYALTVSGQSLAAKLQTIKIQEPFDNEITGMTTGRSYVGNQGNEIFSTDIPVITDFDVAPSNIYIMTFNCTFGKFKIPGVATVDNTVSFQGTKQQCNAAMGGITFYPNKDYSETGFFTYTQQKNNVTQVTIQVQLTGSPGVYQTKVVEFPTSMNYVLTYDDLTYARYFDVMAVGGGGPGGNKGGGGGGGCLFERIDADGSELTTLKNSGATYLNAVVSPGGFPAIIGPIPNTVLSEYAYQGDIALSTQLYPKRADNSIPSIYTSPTVRYLANGGRPGANTYTLSGSTYSYNMTGGQGGGSVTWIGGSSSNGGQGGQWTGSSSSTIPTLTLEQGGGGGGGAKESNTSSSYQSNNVTLEDVAGSAGGAPINENAGVGGAGKFSEIMQATYGGGGAGFSRFPGLGGAGGGGNTSTAGTANTGGGGGGKAGGGSQGGSGFVAVRFRA